MSVEEPLCQFLLVHRPESLFLYKGVGVGALYPSSPIRGPVDIAIFGTIPVIPVSVVFPINRCLKAQGPVSVCLCLTPFWGL